MQNTKEIDYSVGDIVRVFKRANEEVPFSKIHEGIVVKAHTKFLQVWQSSKDGGDSSDPTTAELFPIAGKNMYCQLVKKGSRLKGINSGIW